MWKLTMRRKLQTAFHGGSLQTAFRYLNRALSSKPGQSGPADTSRRVPNNPFQYTQDPVALNESINSIGTQLEAGNRHFPAALFDQNKTV